MFVQSSIHITQDRFVLEQRVSITTVWDSGADSYPRGCQRFEYDERRDETFIPSYVGRSNAETTRSEVRHAPDILMRWGRGEERAKTGFDCKKVENPWSKTRQCDESSLALPVTV